MYVKTEAYGRNGREKKARYFDGYIDGIVEALTLFSCLEQGRFQNKWGETLEKLHREQEEK